MRKIVLDIVRGIAVILVLFRHSDLPESNPIKYFGWLGVDLFFVLSGYLISNLLFSEYRKRQDINVKRFLVRRSLKIFPPFYFFMAVTLLVYAFQGRPDFRWQQYLVEVFYLQSYLPEIWTHTWSLAVEEQFYLVFAGIVALLLWKKGLENKRGMIGSLVFLLILTFVMRFIVSYKHRDEEVFTFMRTHLRWDGILVGVLISYLLNFTDIKVFLDRFQWLLLPFCLLLISIGFVYPGGGFFMNTVGLSMVNVGFGILLLLLLRLNDFLENKSLVYWNILLKPAAFIGTASYSIYLWHLNAKELSIFLFSYDAQTMTLLFMLLAVVLGIFMSYLIEKPVDYFRNKITWK